MCDNAASTNVPQSASSLASRPVLIKTSQAEAMKPISRLNVFTGKCSVRSVNLTILSQVFVSSVCDIAANKCVPHCTSLLTSCKVLIKSTQAETMKPTNRPHVFLSKYSVRNVSVSISSQVCVSSMCNNTVRICVSESDFTLASCPVSIKPTQAMA